MKHSVTGWFLMSLGLVVVISTISRISVNAAFAAVADEGTPEISTTFDDSPEDQAIVKMLKERGEDEILKTAYAVAMSKLEDFATVKISYSHQDESAKAELYLFKENESWVAYPDLPTHKDHPAVFRTLAWNTCMSQYKNFQGIGFIDDTWESKDPQKRTINIVCSEFIDNQWEDHRLTFVYEYDVKKGWHITGKSEYVQPSLETPRKEKAPSSLPENAGVKINWDKAKSAIEAIYEFIGGNPQPVFINFGTAGQNFIQFHYVTENESKDILSVDWQEGKISSPQTSGLAMPCPPIPSGEINFELVPGIFNEISRKAKQGDMINVNLSRRFANGCHEPIWQGIISSSKHLITVTYSIDGKQTGIEEYSF